MGFSNDPERRLLEHNESPHLTFTSKHRPWKLVAQFVVGNEKGEAMKVEKYIKKRKSVAFVEKCIAKQKDQSFIDWLKDKVA